MRNQYIFSMWPTENESMAISQLLKYIVKRWHFIFLNFDSLREKSNFIFVNFCSGAISHFLKSWIRHCVDKVNRKREIAFISAPEKELKILNALYFLRLFKSEKTNCPQLNSFLLFSADHFNKVPSSILEKINILTSETKLKNPRTIFPLKFQKLKKIVCHSFFSSIFALWMR